MLSQLVYVSVRRTTTTEADIAAILEACQRNNKALDITGVLLYSDTHFFQYLEGEQAEIKGLYERIKGDSRHDNVVMIANEPIAERAFPSWQMGAKEYSTDSVEFRTELSAAERDQFQAILAGDTGHGGRALSLMQKLFR